MRQAEPPKPEISTGHPQPNNKGKDMKDEYATLRAAFHAGAKIQAWHLNEGATTSADGRWDDLAADGEPRWSCPSHLYRVKPDDLALLVGLAIYDKVKA